MTATTATKSILALLIQDPSADPGPIREAAAQGDAYPVKLQCVEQLSTALARIAGGGVDLVLLDVSSGKAPERRLETLLELLHQAPQLPTVVVCGSGNESFALKAMRAGAADYVVREQLGAGLGKVLHSAIQLTGNVPPPAGLKMPERRANGRIMAFIGAKGGVGTTTVALNIACILARRSTVILVEMRPTFGSLALYLQPHGLTRNLSHLLRPERSAPGPIKEAASLWVYRNAPGLRVLFGPQTAGECAEIEPEQARAITRSLSRMADYVILDLPASVSEANRAVIEQSTSMTLVVERDPVCVQSGRWMAQAIGTWNATPQPIGALIVNSVVTSSPMPLPEIYTRLGCQLLGVIPPDADLCLSAQNACAPLVTLYPESLMAESLNVLSEVLAPAHSMVG
jgi:pilus assembly protein CpaE